MKTLLIGLFALAGTSLMAQEVVTTTTNTLKASKKYVKVVQTTNTSKMVASVDKKKHYATLVRSVNVIKD